MAACYVSASTHLDDSQVGFRRPCVHFSQTLLAFSLPMEVSTNVSSRGQSSKSRERTRDRWVPKFRWIPEHSIQISAPRFRLAQVGSGARKWPVKHCGRRSLALKREGHKTPSEGNVAKVRLSAPSCLHIWLSLSLFLLSCLPFCQSSSANSLLCSFPSHLLLCLLPCHSLGLKAVQVSPSLIIKTFSEKSTFRLEVVVNYHQTLTGLHYLIIRYLKQYKI